MLFTEVSGVLEDLVVVVMYNQVSETNNKNCSN